MSRNTETYKKVVDFIRQQYQTEEFLPLHVPVFKGNEKKYLNECIDSTFVSSVGKFVDDVEKMFAEMLGAKYAVAAVNGTAALHLALIVSGVEKDDEVITQPLTFVATCNAIRYQHAHPVFVDVDKETMGLSPDALEAFLKDQTEVRNGERYNKKTGRRIKACMPMHTFGHPVRLDEIKELCLEYGIILIEDSAESVGSYYKEKHTGNHGLVSAFSFNGNKTITCGGGGMLVSNDENIAKKAKYISTVAKAPHRFAFYHTELGYNYRMPNLNAALLMAQLEQLEGFLKQKRQLSTEYEKFFSGFEDITFIKEPDNCKSNYWLNAIAFKSNEEQIAFLEYSNDQGVMTRPAWDLMPDLPEFKSNEVHSISNSRELSNTVVNIPSSVINNG